VSAKFPDIDATLFDALSKLNELVGDVVEIAPQPSPLIIPTEWQVGSRHYFDKVHVVECPILRRLLRVVQRIQMMIRISRALTPREPLQRPIRHLRSKPQTMNLMRKRMSLGTTKVILQIMHMRLSITEALSRRKVEVSYDLVDADAAFDAAAFAALLVELLAVVFALALFDVFAAAEGPGDGGVGFAHFGAGVAAAGFYGVGRGRGAVALAAVFGVEVSGFVFVAVGGPGLVWEVCKVRAAILQS